MGLRVGVAAGSSWFSSLPYSMGLRLGEGLGLEVCDIDAAGKRVHVRNGKGGKDRYVPLPDATLQHLRCFWLTHRNPRQLFPNGSGIGAP